MHTTTEDFRSEDSAENFSLTLKLNRNGEKNDAHIYLMISDYFALWHMWYLFLPYTTHYSNLFFIIYWYFVQKFCSCW